MLKVTLQQAALPLPLFETWMLGLAKIESVVAVLLTVAMPSVITPLTSLPEATPSLKDSKGPTRLA